MSKRRLLARKFPPDRAENLVQQFRSAAALMPADLPLFIGGKSMGGRIASMMADAILPSSRLKGCICLGYPFHSLSKPEKFRIEHLHSIETQTLIVQGERDPMGSKKEVVNYQLSQRIHLQWIPDGDHDFRPRKRSGHTTQLNLNMVVEEVDRFITRLTKTTPPILW